jgi:hypothetical protein
MNEELEKLLQAIRGLFEGEYQRGIAEGEAKGARTTLERIVRAATNTGATTSNGHADPGGHQPRKRGGKERAPTGVPRAFVDRVIREAGGRGASPKEIVLAHRTGHEMLVSFSAIRNELGKGLEDRRYKNRGGRYYWRAENQAAEAGASPHSAV